MSGIYLSATRKSSGKTTLSIGLCDALKRRGLKVQPFKKGPDYIDPMWLSAAAGRECINLDFNTMSATSLKTTFGAYAQSADISLLEGNKGLFDGVALSGSDCNAAMAKLLGLPVVLVLDTKGMTRGVAPLLIGYQQFDPELKIAGVILNQVGGSRHESKLRNVITHYTDIPVLGAVAQDTQLQITERHLGLIPEGEQQVSAQTIHRIGDAIVQQVDIDSIVSMAGKVQHTPLHQTATPAANHPGLRIGIARDSAFCFYYADDLEAMRKAGAELVFFSPLEDSVLPTVDGLFLGGGFPETHAEKLSKNNQMLTQIKQFSNNGGCIYAECGGLMYLSRQIRWQDRQYPMAGAIPADSVMHRRPIGRGYVKLQANQHHPWQSLKTVPAHEFHYASLDNINPDIQFAWQVLRGHGIDGQQDGLIHGNILASFSHLRHAPASPWVPSMLQWVADNRRSSLLSDAKQITK